jgi:nucleoside-triphosphatase
MELVLISPFLKTIVKESVRKVVKRVLLITGRPVVGKTTVLLNAANELKNRGYSIGGMLSREVREKGTRIGFEIIDFSKGNKGWLAHINQPTGPQVSKYRVNLDDLDQIGVKAIQNALKEAEVVVIDEIGPMELFSQAFRQAIKEAVDSQKLVLGVIHHSAQDPMIDSIKKRNDTEILEATIENRQGLHNILIQKAIQFLKEERRN